jgi:hypothetical protein
MSYDIMQLASIQGEGSVKVYGRLGTFASHYRSIWISDERWRCLLICHGSVVDDDHIIEMRQNISNWGKEDKGIGKRGKKAKLLTSKWFQNSFCPLRSELTHQFGYVKK